MEGKTTNPFTIAMLYIGSLLGAGFASGKEIYAYFGAFGSGGLWGLLLVTALFVGFGVLLVQYACWKRPESYLDLLDLGNARLRAVLDWAMFVVFATVFMAMLAAGGAVWVQQLGVPAFAGSLATALLVYAIVLRGIGGIVRALQYMVPVALVLALGIAVILLARAPAAGQSAGVVSDPGFFGLWPMAALVYLSYNFIGSIPILSVAVDGSSPTKKTLLGGVLGGLGLGASALLLFLALAIDPVASDAYPMPMLFFAGELSPFVQVLYTIAMLLAILCAAINSLYVVAGRLPGPPKKKAALLAVICAACYGLSLMGFTNVVERVYPVQGYFGFGVILLLVVGFVKEARRRKDAADQPESTPTPME